MKLTKDCIATPGFAGFVPSLRYQFGDTYGNSSRRILETDPTLKSGKIQKKVQEKRAVSKTAPPHDTKEPEEGKSKEYVWRLKNKYQTGDDRFNFPPVPGYILPQY